MSSVTEQEILEATHFDPPREYPDRQDYLAALCKAVNKLEDIEFDALSTEAADWFNDSVRAMNNKKDLPEFADTEDDDEAEEVAAKPAPVKAMTEPKKAAVKAVEEKVIKRRAKGAPARQLEHPKIDPQASIDNFETDRYGVVKGSKNAAAVAMLEGGCRMTDITASIGGTYYNLVARLMKQGHHVEKGANGMIKLAHKDD